MIDGIEALRDDLGTFERAWMRAQADEDLENPAHATLYAGAELMAADRVQYVDAMLGTLVPYLEALDLDPNDSTGLHYAVAQGETDPAIRVALALRQVQDTFKHWAADGGFSDVLNAAELRIREWIEGQPELPAMAAALAETKARAARAEMAQRGQNSGRTRANAERVNAAQQRAEAARDACGTSDLLDAARTLTGDALVALALVYGFADAEEFQREADYNNSNLRKKLERDAKRL